MAFFMATGAAFEFLLCHNKFWRKRCPQDHLATPSTRLRQNWRKTGANQR